MNFCQNKNRKRSKNKSRFKKVHPSSSTSKAVHHILKKGKKPHWKIQEFAYSAINNAQALKNASII
jgi:hypothetical protein